VGCVFLLFSLAVFSAVRIASVIEKMVWGDVCRFTGFFATAYWQKRISNAGGAM